MTQTLTPTQMRQWLQNEVINRIMENIGIGDQKYISGLIEDLIEKNRPFTHSLDGFLYGGTFFSLLPPKQARLVEKFPLDRSLYPEGDELVAATKELKRDTIRLQQGLSLVLRDCSNFQDIRDALPNSARMVLPVLAQYERTRPVAYTLSEKPLLLDQYPETERLFQYYISSRMLD